MAIGKRIPKQDELFIPAAQVATGPGHPFYAKLNAVLAEAGFDEFVEKLCAPYYKEGGRPSIPPGVYFRMLFIGYFEGLDSQRGIAWRCADSLGLRAFLGFRLTEETPVHPSMTMIRQRLPESVFDRVFVFVLGLLQEKGLLRGKTVAIDATTLEANAAMKSIVRKDTGEDWKEYLRGLAKAEGMENPTEEDLRRLDRGRKDKKVSNQQWESPSDPDSRIAKMKDGRTHLAYKAEHAVDLESEAIMATTVTFADQSDPQTGPVTLSLAEANLVLAGSATKIAEAVMDKGYHDNSLLTRYAEQGLRTYIPERRQKSRCWKNKPAEQEQAFRANHQRVRGKKGRRLNRWRSERCERTFAHVCETGGGRRAWLRGQTNVSKTHTLKCAAYNLGLLLRKVWGMRKPRNADEGVWGGLLAGLAWLALAAVIVYRMTTQPDNLFWDIAGLLLLTAVTGRAFGFINRSRKTAFFNGLLGRVRPWLIVFGTFCLFAPFIQVPKIVNEPPRFRLTFLTSIGNGRGQMVFLTNDCLEQYGTNSPFFQDKGLLLTVPLVGTKDPGDLRFYLYNESPEPTPVISLKFQWSAEPDLSVTNGWSGMIADYSRGFSNCLACGFSTIVGGSTVGIPPIQFQKTPDGLIGVKGAAELTVIGTNYSTVLTFGIRFVADTNGTAFVREVPIIKDGLTVDFPNVHR